MRTGSLLFSVVAFAFLAVAAPSGAILVHPDELSEAWIERAVRQGVDVLAIHPEGGGKAHLSLDRLLKRCQTKQFQSLVDLAYSRGLTVEYEGHAGTWLLPRELFDEHPEYFRIGRDGKRTTLFNFCVSNTNALKVVGERAKFLVRSLYRSSHRHFFWLDDAKDSSCQCPQCAKLTASDQALVALNFMLREIRTVEPDATLAYLAYFDTMKPPQAVKPSPGIFLEYAPMARVWDRPISEQTIVTAADVDRLFAVFGKRDSRVLEYWLDNSMFSKWEKPPKKFAPNASVIRADLTWYASLGFEEIATFACFLGADYERLWGEPDVSPFMFGNTAPKGK